MKGYIKYLITRWKKLDIKMKIVVASILVLVCLFPTITLSRFLYTAIVERYYITQNFYFNSEYMSLTGLHRYSSYWNGADEVVQVISVNSKSNDLKYTDVDVLYTIDYCITESDTNLNCVSGGTSTNDVELVADFASGSTRTIKAKKEGNTFTNVDEFNINLRRKGIKEFKDGTSVTIKYVAKSTKPYTKTITGYMTYIVTTKEYDYEVSDSINDIFATLRLSNSISSAKPLGVTIKFDNRFLKLDLDNKYYMELKRKCSDTVTEKCYMTDMFYKVKTPFTKTYEFKEPVDDGTTLTKTVVKKYEVGNVIPVTEIDGDGNKVKPDTANKANVSTEKYEYVSGLITEIDALSSISVNFYKDEVEYSYKYPAYNGQWSPIVVEIQK